MDDVAGDVFRALLCGEAGSLGAQAVGEVNRLLVKRAAKRGGGGGGGTGEYNLAPIVPPPPNAHSTAKGAIKVGTSRYCPPCHPMHFEPATLT
jgi:hypothetical protein